MDNRHHNIESIIRSAFISEEDWRIFVNGSQYKDLEKGSHLIVAGDHVDCAYFCIEGLFRMYYTHMDGREYNKSFVQENQFFTSYGAMVSGEPSYFSIQAIENAKIMVSPYALLERLMERSHMWERFIRKGVEQLYIKKEERERQLLFLTAEERYNVFHSQYPGLSGRIPQYHIASYLGITSVSLSRIIHSS